MNEILFLKESIKYIEDYIQTQSFLINNLKNFINNKEKNLSLNNFEIITIIK